MPRILLLLAFMAGKVASTKLFWYVVFLALSGYLAIAPAAQRWNNKATTRGFIGLAVTLPIAWGLSRDVSMQLTSVKIKRHIGFQVSIDEMVHHFNEIRATNNAILAEIEGKAQDWLSNPMAGMGMPMIMPVPVAGELPPVEEDSQKFSLDMIRSSAKSHVMLVGETGSGKTTLAKFLSIDLFGGQDVAVYDCDDDGKTWGQFPVFGQEDDFTEISACLKLDLKEFQKRSSDRVQGTLSDRKVVRIIEEMPSTMSEVAFSYEWLMTLLRRGRKRNMGIVGVTQDRNISALKCRDKEGNLQEISARTLSNFTIIYLKAEAFAALDRVRDKETRNQLRQSLQGCSRPALVEFDGQFYWWEVPDLKHWQMPNMGTEAQIYQELCDDAPEQPELPANDLLKLEQLFKQNAEHPIERFYHADVDESLVEFFGDDGKPKSGLSVPAQTILDKYTQKEMYGTWIDAKWVKQYVFYTKELKQFSASEVRGFLKELSDSGRGSTGGDEANLTWLMEQS
ncbi:MAG TPA: type IV secretory system conjugative DNA transfer family protein [Allocoleopsis sp.]